MFRHLKWAALLFPLGTETMKNVALRSGNWGMVFYLVVFVGCMKKTIFSAVWFTTHLELAPGGFCECPPWGIMRAERRKVNKALLGVALKAVSFLCFWFSFHLKAAKPLSSWTNIFTLSRHALWATLMWFRWNYCYLDLYVGMFPMHSPYVQCRDICCPLKMLTLLSWKHCAKHHSLLTNLCDPGHFKLLCFFLLSLFLLIFLFPCVGVL